ncbi:hypothetical protein CYMTET_20144 [Cymbomonas tetramitiformis]|uniref:C2 domain-containing protein n=1 Tax=Cymbomonas tetramitiformis TaxID=36881 RepID=A0AAE0G4P4_9CHLO|nr:hypothetical protein CYMTET_20144 [Cymbomonas tetramitiformis]
MEFRTRERSGVRHNLSLSLPQPETVSHAWQRALKAWRQATLLGSSNCDNKYSTGDGDGTDQPQRKTSRYQSQIKRSSICSVAGPMGSCRLGVRLLEGMLEDGKQDSYCEVEVIGVKRRSNTVKRTDKPKYEDLFIFDIDDIRDVTVNVSLFISGMLSSTLKGTTVQKLPDWWHGADDENTPEPAWCTLYSKSGVMLKSQVRLQLIMRHHSAQFMTPISLFVGSWNVGNAPPAADLTPWLKTRGHGLVVIGTQECFYEHRSFASSCHEDWSITLQEHLGDQYMLLEAISMGQIRINGGNGPSTLSVKCLPCPKCLQPP